LLRVGGVDPQEKHHTHDHTQDHPHRSLHDVHPPVLHLTIRHMVGVPLIDLAAARAGDRADRIRIARRLDEACRHIGFFTITGHGVSPAVVQDLREAAHAFFTLSGDYRDMKYLKTGLRTTPPS
jgi:non-haem dioxygenase in morphine synthesis N-terminal